MLTHSNPNLILILTLILIVAKLHRASCKLRSCTKCAQQLHSVVHVRHLVCCCKKLSCSCQAESTQNSYKQSCANWACTVLCGRCFCQFLHKYVCSSRQISALIPRSVDIQARQWWRQWSTILY